MWGGVACSVPVALRRRRWSGQNTLTHRIDKWSTVLEFLFPFFIVYSLEKKNVEQV